MSMWSRVPGECSEAERDTDLGSTRDRRLYAQVGFTRLAWTQRKSCEAPHPNAAKLYLTWFLAREQQSRLGSFSSRVDVPPPEGFQPLASYKIANNYREFMTNDKLVADLRKRFEGYTGPPANKGGVR